VARSKIGVPRAREIVGTHPLGNRISCVFGMMTRALVGLRRLAADRLTLAAAAWLVVALSASAFVVWGFAEITEEVVEGESRAFDRAVLLWIAATVPAWMNGPMRAVTALGYYYVVLPLLAACALAFYLRDWRLSAVMLVISAAGGVFLTTVLKGVFRRARPEIMDSGYTAGFYSFPSGHATVAVGFYGALALILAYHLRGPARSGPWCCSERRWCSSSASRASTSASTTRRTCWQAFSRHPCGSSASGASTRCGSPSAGSWP